MVLKYGLRGQVLEYSPKDGGVLFDDARVRNRYDDAPLRRYGLGCMVEREQHRCQGLSPTSRHCKPVETWHACLTAIRLDLLSNKINGPSATLQTSEICFHGIAILGQGRITPSRLRAHFRFRIQ